MSFEQPQPLELSAEQKEKIEQFEQELGEAVESVAGLTESEFIEQNLEVFGDEETARQIYQEMEFPLRGFESWDEDLAEEMLKKLQQNVLQGYKLVETFTREDKSQVDVLKTKVEDMQVLRIKDETGHIEWILKPIEAKIEK